jgi:hypothetical protein
MSNENTAALTLTVAEFKGATSGRDRAAAAKLDTFIRARMETEPTVSYVEHVRRLGAELAQRDRVTVSGRVTPPPPPAPQHVPTAEDYEALLGALRVLRAVESDTAWTKREQRAYETLVYSKIGANRMGVIGSLADAVNRQRDTGASAFTAGDVTTLREEIDWATADVAALAAGQK